MAETFDVEAARARCESATPGPWRWLLPERENDDAVMVGTGSGDSLVLTTCVMPQERDLAFIAHARTDLPAALDEIERLRAAVRHVVYRNHADSAGCEGCLSARELAEPKP